MSSCSPHCIRFAKSFLQERILSDFSSGGKPPSGNDSSSGQSPMDIDSREGKRVFMCSGSDLKFVHPSISIAVKLGACSPPSGKQTKFQQSYIFRLLSFRHIDPCDIVRDSILEFKTE